MDWNKHIALLNEISLLLLEKAKVMLENNETVSSEVFQCLSESRKCVETALKFRLMTKSIELEEEMTQEFEEIELDEGLVKGEKIDTSDVEINFINPLREEDEDG